MNNRIRIVTTDGNIHEFRRNRTGWLRRDGGPAVSAQLFHPSGIAIDSKGNVYIADSFNNVIRVVLPGGTIATVAGTGASGYSGDGGVATAAQFNFPTGLAIDASGNLVVADTNNSVIRQLTPNGTTTFVAGPSISAAYSLQAYGGSASIAPGSWIEIHGSNLAVDSRPWNNSDFNGNTAPTVLDGTKVNLGAQSLYVEFIGQSQINALVPSTMGSGPQLLTVTTPSGKSAPFPITVNTVQPGLLAPSSFNVNATQYVVALFQDGITYVLPPNAIAGVTSRPAKAGDNMPRVGSIGLRTCHTQRFRGQSTVERQPDGSARHCSVRPGAGKCHLRRIGARNSRAVSDQPGRAERVGQRHSTHLYRRIGQRDADVVYRGAVGPLEETFNMQLNAATN